ncbi:MAG: hypothetical protein ACLGI3_15450 [Actinomycetes bacterium]
MSVSDGRSVRDGHGYQTLVAITIRLVRRLTMAALSVLGVATAGSQHDVRASWHRERTYSLVNQVVAATGDPGDELHGPHRPHRREWRRGPGSKHAY